MAGSGVLTAAVTVRPLVETGHAGTVAGWLHGAWWADEGWSRAGTEAWLRAASGPAIPMVFVAEVAGEAVGTATLDVDDLPSRPELTPWLAGVWVPPGWRRRGVATRLVRAVEAAAAARGFAELWLFTPDMAGVYRGLGWADAGAEVWRGRAVALMRRAL